jgi:hypothetical protein
MFGFGGWQTVTATVVSRRLLKEWRTQHEHSVGTKRRKFEFMLDVRPDDGSPRYRATCTTSSFDPVQGDEVQVLCKPARQKVKFDADRILHPEKYRPQQPKPSVRGGGRALGPDEERRAGLRAAGSGIGRALNSSSTLFRRDGKNSSPVFPTWLLVPGVVRPRGPLLAGGG